jgi:hypothetical protein
LIHFPLVGFGQANGGEPGSGRGDGIAGGNGRGPDAAGVAVAVPGPVERSRGGAGGRDGAVRAQHRQQLGPVRRRLHRQDVRQLPRNGPPRPRRRCRAGRPPRAHAPGCLLLRDARQECRPKGANVHRVHQRGTQDATTAGVSHLPLPYCSPPRPFMFSGIIHIFSV